MMPISSSRVNAFLFNIILSLPSLLSGCSFSDSSASLSDSVTSISDSSESIASSASSSASASKKHKKFHREVSDYTMVYVNSPHPQADAESFLKGISDIAARRGIVNWDQSAETYIAIGKGLREAGAAGMTYENYRRSFAQGDPEKMKNIQKGYDSQ